MSLKIYRHILWTVLVLLLSPSLAQSAQTVVVAFSEFPPYKMIVDGTHRGIDVDILQEIGKQMDFVLDFKNGTFEECLGMIKQGGGRPDDQFTAARRTVSIHALRPTPLSGQV